MTKQLRWMLRSIALVILGVALWVGLHQPTLAQLPSSVSTRISRLESENSTLRSRVNRLESDIARLGRASGVELSPPPSSTTGTPAADPMFDRLATLVIELRERIIALEAQVFGS